jgi:hypothetical protein
MRKMKVLVLERDENEIRDTLPTGHGLMYYRYDGIVHFKRDHVSIKILIVNLLK